MKHVLVVGMTSNPGGMESVVMNYYRAIDRDLVKLDFLSNEPHIAYEEEIHSLGGATYSVTSRHRNPKRFRDELTLFMEEQAHHYDALWFNACSVANIDYLVAAERYGIPKRIMHCHNSKNGEGLLRGILHKINRPRVLKYATDCWACADDATPWFFGKTHDELPNYKFIPNAIDVERYQFNSQMRDLKRLELGISADAVVIGNVGRLMPQKNQKFLVSLMPEILRQEPRAELLVVGEGSLRPELETQIHNLGLEKQIHLLGARNDMAELYSAMDCFVLPSLFEGFGEVVVEAQASGLPVLCSPGVLAASAFGLSQEIIPLGDLDRWAQEIVVYACNADSSVRGEIKNNIVESSFNIQHSKNIIQDAFNTLEYHQGVAE